MTRFRRRKLGLADEHGLTVVEMTISMVLLVAVISMFGSILPNSMNSANSLTSQSESVDSLVLSMTAIARELRSAQCIYTPAENTSGSSLHFTSSVNNNDPYTFEVIYSITGGTLTRQLVADPLPPAVIEAQHLVNYSNAFQQISTPRRTVVLSFQDRVDPHASPRAFTTTVAGRNAWRTCPAPL